MEASSIVISAGTSSDSELREQIDIDIKSFDEFFQSLGNDPLVGPEKAILTTYLLYKTHSKEELEKLRQR